MDRAKQVLDEIEQMAQQQFLPLVGRAKGKILHELIKKHKVNYILEVGTLFGYSAILMAQALPEDGKITTIEIDAHHTTVAEQMIAKAGLSKKITVMHGDALEILPQLSDLFDLIFLDAQKTQYSDYLKHLEKNLKPGSVLVADNVGIFRDKVQDYLKLVKHSGKYESKTIIVPLGLREGNDAMEVSIRKEINK
ncbi:O-methyltransferase [Candidatus Woesearchaeota archaeon]|nr:O-methyltransferase [Candidatus Woesearchaeota archaeon]